MLILIKNIINNNETSIPGPAGPVLCTVCTPLCSVLAAPPIHQLSRLVVWSPRPPPRPSYQNTDLIKWSQNISQIVSSFLQMFWWNFCLLYYSLRRLECSSVSRDVRPTNGRWGLSWWERRDPSWSVSAWPATNISNNNNNAQSDQPDTILFHYTITRLLLSPAQ